MGEFGDEGQGLVGGGLGGWRLGLVDLGDFFGGRVVEVVVLGVAVAVAVDGDAALGEVSGAFGLVAADGGQRGEQESEFADIGEALVVMRVVGVAEVDQMADDLVGGEFVDEVGAEEFVVAQVAEGGGGRAVQALGDLSDGEALFSELLSVQDFGSAGRVWVAWEGHGWVSCSWCDSFL